MSNYVCGFMCSYDLTRFLLIRKTHPEWQKGKLNGIGGKIESNRVINIKTGEMKIMQSGEKINVSGESQIFDWVAKAETPFEAMIREFHEETGITTTRNRWHCFYIKELYDVVEGVNIKVYYFAAFGDEVKSKYIGENNDPLFETVDSYTLIDLMFHPVESVVYDLGYIINIIISNIKNGTFRQLNPHGVNNLS